MSAPRLSLVLLLLFSTAACRPGMDQFALSLNAKPKLVRDDGTPLVINVSALQIDGPVGKGSVKLQSTAGSLIDGSTVQLDENGAGSIEFICDLAQDPGCVDELIITGSWLTSGYVIVAELKLNTIVTDARASACAPKNLRKLTLPTSPNGNIRIAIADTMPEVRQLGLGTSEKGVAVWDATSVVGALAFTTPSMSASLADEQKRIRDLCARTGSLTNPLERTFTMWDGSPAVRSTFELGGTTMDTIKARLDALSMGLVGVTSGLTGATNKGPYKVVMTVALRSNSQTAVSLAVAPSVLVSDAVARELDDLAGGSSMALDTDTPSASSCEVFTANRTASADIVWVVDDSCSMGSSQTAVATVGGQVAARLVGAQIDFRAAGVSTGYFENVGWSGSVRDWTTSTTEMVGWFTGASAWGTNGSGLEAGFEGLQSFVDGLHPANASIVPGPPRSGVDLHFIFLTDAPEQSMIAAAEMVDFFTQKLPGRRVVAHGILCPESLPPPAMASNCGDSNEDVSGKYHALVRQTGGVLGSIKTFNATPVTPTLSGQQADTMRAIVQSVISGAGYPLRNRPIGASIRVATSATKGVCDNTDIPRDDDNGWQIDSITGNLSFVGACGPPMGATIAVSYQYWQH